MSYLLHEVFKEALNQHADKIAIIQEDNKSITYKELDKLSNKYAHCISSIKSSAKENPYVGILSIVNINSIAAILGILKAGYAYVPLDEHSPIERLKKIAKKTNLDVIVADPVFYEQSCTLCEENHIKKVIYTSEHYNKINKKKVISNNILLQYLDTNPPQINQLADDLAYVLHSSGSTGMPKGIMLSHRNARTFVDWMHKEFAVTANDIVMSRAPFKFDLSVFDIFNTFKAGARLICFNWNLKRPDNQRHKDYVSLMEREDATILYTTPSTFITLMNRGDLESAIIPLTRLMYAGEPFPIPQLRRLKATFPNAHIANIYGPTETNIITYYWIDQISDDTKEIPLGQVVDDTEIIVVSENQKRICEPKEIGELWCRGGTVTLGYLGMPRKTQECLVTSPFHAYPCTFWRTGDFGYRDANGVLHYKGRRDHMIKVKGYRIEIGEIETAFALFKGVDEFVVVAIPHADHGHELFGFFSRLPRTTFNSLDILTFLKIKIPAYMIPSALKELPLLPKTSSGKVDRVLLAELIKSEVQNVA